jgi:hypothetical protein
VLPGFRGHLVSEYFVETHLPAWFPTTLAAEAARAQQELRRWSHACRTLGPASSVRALFDVGANPLIGALDFPRVSDRAPIDTGLAGIVRQGGCAIVLVVTPWGESLDRWWRPAVTLAGDVQGDWALLFNGTHLRVLDAARLHLRRFLEFEIAVALDVGETFRAFWSLLHASTLATADAASRTRLHELIAASDRQSAAVSRSLRHGVLAASADVLSALVGPSPKASRSVPLTFAFEQSLTIIYRLLFLFFAEARGLVPVWHPVYRESYSLETLRAEVERSRTPTGLWDALRAIGRAAARATCA